MNKTLPGLTEENEANWKDFLINTAVSPESEIWAKLSLMQGALNAAIRWAKFYREKLELGCPTVREVRSYCRSIHHPHWCTPGWPCQHSDGPPVS